MVTREFEIVGDNVADVGMRSGLIDKSVEYDVSVYASNLSKNLVKVIINGDNESIAEFLDAIRRVDIRVKRDTPKNYRISELKEYSGPEIDWNRNEIRFLSKLMYKGFKEANTRLLEIEKKLNKGHS
jgi:acylphosphatase